MVTLNFKGKSFVQNHHLTVPYHELISRKGKTLTHLARTVDDQPNQQSAIQINEKTD